MKQRTFLILSTALSVQFCIGLLSYTSSGRPCGTAVPLVLRILILIPLLIPAIYAFRDRKSVFSVCIIAALALCGAGDLFISLGMALGGAVFFFFVHALNAGNFLRKFYSSGLDLGWKDFLSGIVIFAAGFILYTSLFSGPLASDTPMLVMVLLYAIVLSYALWISFLLYKTGSCSFWLAVFAGELLFYITDIEVAYSELILHHPANEWVNNIIYYTGLYLLSVSTLLEEE